MALKDKTIILYSEGEWFTLADFISNNEGIEDSHGELIKELRGLKIGESTGEDMGAAGDNTFTRVEKEGDVPEVMALKDKTIILYDHQNNQWLTLAELSSPEFSSEEFLASDIVEKLRGVGMGESQTWESGDLSGNWKYTRVVKMGDVPEVKEEDETSNPGHHAGTYVTDGRGTILHIEKINNDSSFDGKIVSVQGESIQYGAIKEGMIPDEWELVDFDGLASFSSGPETAELMNVAKSLSEGSGNTEPPISGVESIKIRHNGVDIDGGGHSVELYYTLIGLGIDKSLVRKIIYESFLNGQYKDDKIEVYIKRYKQKTTADINSRAFELGLIKEWFEEITLEDAGTTDGHIEPKINQPDYKYYVIDASNRIITGWEYKEDARDFVKEMSQYNYRVTSKRDCPVDPNDNNNWSSGASDSVRDLIKRAVSWSIEMSNEVSYGIRELGNKSAQWEAVLTDSLKQFMAGEESTVDKKNLLKAVKGYTNHILHRIEKSNKYGLPFQQDFMDEYHLAGQAENFLS